MKAIEQLRRLPVFLLCFIAHLSGFIVALTIDKNFWTYLIAALIGMTCIVIGMFIDDPSA